MRAIWVGGVEEDSASTSHQCFILAHLQIGRRSFMKLVDSIGGNFNLRKSRQRQASVVNLYGVLRYVYFRCTSWWTEIMPITGSSGVFHISGLVRSGLRFGRFSTQINLDERIVAKWRPGSVVRLLMVNISPESRSGASQHV